MLKSQVHQYSQSVQTLFPRHQTTFLAGDGSSGGAVASSLFRPINKLSLIPIQHKPFRLNKRHNPNCTTTIKAVAEGSTNQNVHQSLITSVVTSVKATITVQTTIGGALSNLSFTRGLDDISDLLGKSILLELVAAEVDPKRGLEKKTIKDHAYRQGKGKDGVVKYLAEFEVPEEFGDIGGVLVQNEHHKEMYIKNIAIEGFPIGTINVTCNSWVHPKFDYPEKRIFFTNKSYLPSATPSGLKALREKDLKALRGDGTGQRKKQDRIYDYDVYNDLGEPDARKPSPRPVLGGEQHPYPRRCRTGRPPSKKDPLSESRSSAFYVPRDEAFSEVKGLTFSVKTVDSVLHAVVPSLETTFIDSELGFPYFTAIEALFNEGVHLPQLKSNGLASIIPRILKFVEDNQNNVLLFDTPEMIRRDKFSWLRDEEFCRQMLAGVNPCCIQLVTEWPLRSKLDPEIYGPPESAITKECVEEEIRGYSTLEEALKEKKLFLLDYHDVLLPYVNKVRDLTEIRTTLYGSRTLMYLTPTGTLRPLAIELTRPPSDGKPHWNRVYTPCWDSTGAWLWKLAKVHVLAHDSGYHQLVSHWLRTHCCTEPYIIACHRQLSSMHPIFRLLHPHFRYTMEINALARQALINANGIIETSFSTGKYSMELSSVAYDLQWRFDHQALPADLISRGMAVEDASAPHGLRLTIEDYPYANDGLVLWDIIKQWVSSYVNHYYTEPSLIESDAELQAWWTEIRTVGHGDKKDEPWWPVLKSPDDLIGILTTIIWVASGHHAAVNFGQYGYGGYIPNRGTIARVEMPDEDPTADSWEIFKARPEDELLSAFPSQVQATKVMAVLDVLSNHSPDEEYIGQEMEPSFEDDPQIKAAFEIFSGRLKELEGIIDGRNADPNLSNRNGVGIVPYELLKPMSEPGVTGMGVPNSISI